MGRIHEMTAEEETAAVGARIYIGMSLQAPQHWVFNKLRLTILKPDLLAPDDELSPLATMIFRKLRHPGYTPDDVIVGNGFTCTKTMAKAIDFTTGDFAYITQKAIAGT